MIRLRPILTPVLCGALALLPTPLLAAPPDDVVEQPPDGGDDANRQRAIEAYQRGTELYAAADFEAALEAFQEAATLYASPDFQFNIAKCYERLGNYDEAIRHYETYLRTAEESPDRAVVEASIEDLNKRIEQDRAAAEAAEQARKDKEAANQDDTEPKKPPGRALIITGGVLLGVGAAVGIGGGLGFGIPVASDNSTLGDVLSGNPDGLTFAEADDNAGRARTNQTLELVMIGVGGALLVTGVALLAVGMVKNKKAASSTARRLHVAPTYARGGGGLVLGGSF